MLKKMEKHRKELEVGIRMGVGRQEWRVGDAM